MIKRQCCWSVRRSRPVVMAAAAAARGRQAGSTTMVFEEHSNLHNQWGRQAGSKREGQQQAGRRRGAFTRTSSIRETRSRLSPSRPLCEWRRGRPCTPWLLCPSCVRLCQVVRLFSLTLSIAASGWTRCGGLLRATRNLHQRLALLAALAAPSPRYAALRARLAHAYVSVRFGSRGVTGSRRAHKAPHIVRVPHPPIEVWHFWASENLDQQ